MGRDTMQKIATRVPDVWILEPTVFGDHRGYFMETYNQATMKKLGILSVFVQDNQSFTQKKGTLRGIHFQNDPVAQCKLVRVTKGAVLDVAVDLRKNSPTYRQWAAVELSADNKRMLYIPRGFGHGFLTLTDDVEFCYKVDNLYSKACDRSICYNDPELAIEWPVSEPVLSDKDLSAPLLKDSDCNFIYQDDHKEANQ